MADNLKIGEVGVLRVMAELILRGHQLYRPVVDDHGVDLLLSDGIRIQVKTARLHTRKSWGATKKEAYWLMLGWTASGRVHTPIRRHRKYDEECDFLIAHGLDENRFWIIPSFLIGNYQCLVLEPRAPLFKESVDKLLVNGRGVLTAAENLGVSRTTIWRRESMDLQRGGFASSVRLCENHWDFLCQPSESKREKIMTNKHTSEVLVNQEGGN